MIIIHNECAKDSLFGDRPFFAYKNSCKTAEMERKMDRFNIMTDGDGTLVVFDKTKGLDEISAPGYYRGLPILGNISKALEYCSEYSDIYLVSAVMPYPHVIPDKDYCYENIVPFIRSDRRVYTEYGRPKAEQIDGRINILPGDVFLDDYTPNLIEMSSAHPEITCIKVMNGINGTKGTWDGPRLYAFSSIKSIANTIIGLHLAKLQELGLLKTA